MTQASVVIPNSTGAIFRGNINAALMALTTNFIGATPPTPTYPGQVWSDTSAGGEAVRRVRNNANTAWLDAGSATDATARSMASAAQTTANAALPKAGGQMTGAITSVRIGDLLTSRDTAAGRMFSLRQDADHFGLYFPAETRWAWWASTTSATTPQFFVNGEVHATGTGAALVLENRTSPTDTMFTLVAVGPQLRIWADGSIVSTMSSAGKWTFSLRPTWQGFTPWDSGNFTPLAYPGDLTKYLRSDGQWQIPVDQIARDTANAALPLAGGQMQGTIEFMRVGALLTSQDTQLGRVFSLFQQSDRFGLYFPEEDRWGWFFSAQHQSIDQFFVYGALVTVGANAGLKFSNRGGVMAPTFDLYGQGDQFILDHDGENLMTIDAGGAMSLPVRPTFAGYTPWDSGNFTPLNYPGGTASFLREDGTWAVPPGTGGSGGAVAWGGITGNISAQTDLQQTFINAAGDKMTGDLGLTTASFWEVGGAGLARFKWLVRNSGGGNYLALDALAPAKTDTVTIDLNGNIVAASLTGLGMVTGMYGLAGGKLSAASAPVIAFSRYGDGAAYATVSNDTGSITRAFKFHSNGIFDTGIGGAVVASNVTITDPATGNSAARIRRATPDILEIGVWSDNYAFNPIWMLNGSSAQTILPGGLVVGKSCALSDASGAFVMKATDGVTNVFVPRIFVQAADPGALAFEGSLWIWSGGVKRRTGSTWTVV